jgi:hypothetical protein
MPAVPYIRVRDMVRTQDPQVITDELDNSRVSPEERAAQRGLPSWMKIIESVYDGLPNPDAFRAVIEVT